MCGFKLPSARSKVTRIDLTEYGGEGFLSISPITAGDSIALNKYIKQLAKEDGLECKTDEDVTKLSSTVYKFQSLAFTVSCIASGVGDNGESVPISMNDVYDFPPDLIVKIISIMEEDAKFPLAQTAGTGQK